MKEGLAPLLEWHLVGMMLAGFVLHFLGRWGEYWRAHEKLGPVRYVLLDPPAWISAVVGALAFYVALPELGPVLGVQAAGATPLWSLAAGYIGSSMAPKLLAMVAGKAGIR